MALDARDAAERVDQLIILTERLTNLIADQASAFERRRPQEAAGQLEETSRLANLYRHESARVRSQPALIEGATLERRVALMRATEAFDAVLARQGRALEAARTVTEGLVKAIAEEVVSQRSSGTGYGPGATAVAGDARSVTLNRSA
ncbi:flagellar basal body protein [Caulobacter sp. SLTY]|uniref:flagellar basal body protein n=1 Tax=Caulobacter sp. SLTY TaxID=2683262 RepID=UPI001412EAD5|nr:flagellar basal body protein [Caulobacter sp. SLTY]NBB15007.1 flagellar basal body protein [Caulobacter sp. SLTY]